MAGVDGDDVLGGEGDQEPGSAEGASRKDFIARQSSRWGSCCIHEWELRQGPTPYYRWRQKFSEVLGQIGSDMSAPVGNQFLLVPDAAR